MAKCFPSKETTGTVTRKLPRICSNSMYFSFGRFQLKCAFGANKNAPLRRSVFLTEKQNKKLHSGSQLRRISNYRHSLAVKLNAIAFNDTGNIPTLFSASTKPKLL
ncbi:hypothetical protein ACU8KH_04214 [Lachancea thermotolerans]